MQRAAWATVAVCVLFLTPLALGIGGADTFDFSRGDTNGDGVLNVTDATAIQTFLFIGGIVLPCLDAADANDSGSIGIDDALLILNFVYSGGIPPAEPFPECGPDPTHQDYLRCAESSCP